MTVLDGFRDNMMQMLSSKKTPKFLTKPFNSQRRLHAAIALLESIPEGKVLLDYARMRDCKIMLDHQIESRGAYYAPLWQGSSSTIILNSWQTITGIATSLAHELRHEWQYAQLDIGSQLRAQFSPFVDAVFTRLIEGDAYAFTKMIAKKIYKKTGKDYPLHSANELEKDFGFKESFDEFQRSSRAAKYDLDRLSKFKKENEFRVHSASEIAPFNKITLVDVGSRASCYLDNYSNNEDLANHLIAQISCAVQNKIPAGTVNSPSKLINTDRSYGRFS